MALKLLQSVATQELITWLYLGYLAKNHWLFFRIILIAPLPTCEGDM